MNPTQLVLLCGIKAKVWNEWKVAAVDNGYIIADNSGFQDSDFLDKDEAAEAFAKCEVTEAPQAEEPISAEEWREAYQELRENPPQEGDEILTEGESKIRLEIEYRVGKPPFMFARLYIPNVVGSKLGWFARPVGDSSPYGWKVILAPRARDQVIKRFGLAHEVAVQSLVILRQSGDGNSLVAEVGQW